MKFFKNLSIKNKLVAIMLSITFSVVIIGQSVLAYIEIQERKESLVNNFITHSNLIAENCISPLAFGDVKGIKEVLKSNKSVPEIHSIYVFNERKHLFAYQNFTDSTATPDLKLYVRYYETPNFLHINQPILYNGTPFGFLYVKISMKVFQDSIKQKIQYLFLTTLGLFALAYLLSIRLQKLISKPILELSNITKDISSKGDYSRRFSYDSTDEIGMLYQSFNDMLSAIYNKEKERTSAEVALRESEEKFRISFENAPLGIGLIDLEGNLLQVNNELCHLFGYSQNEFLKKKFSSIFHPDDFIETEALINDILKGKSIGKTIEVRFQTKSQAMIWCILNTSLVVLGNSSFLIIQIIDISKRKEAEQAHLQLQNQLQQAHKMETIGTLAGGISHDFKNILNPIIGFTTLAMESLDEESIARKDLERVLKAAKRADELVHQILAFSRQNEQIFSAIDLGSVMKESIDLLRATIPTTVDIKTSIYDGHERVMGNQTQIQQVILNLCTNAYQALPDSQGAISIKLDKINIDQRFVEDNQGFKTGDHLVIEVSDTGKGMSKEVLARIFDPFYTTKKVGEGTGLGLSVAHGVITAHKGHIKVDSNIGEGTCFTIYIPVTNEAREDIIQEENIFHDKFEGTAMVIDDEEMSLALMERILTNLGFDVIINNDSTVALEMLKEAPEIYDLIICDQTMPRLTGTQIAATLKAENIDIPFILNTGSSDYINMDLSDKGVNISIAKPITPDKLKNIISKVLIEAKNKEK